MSEFALREREITDVFAIQDETAQAIVKALEAKLEDAGRAVEPRRPPSNQDAHHAYLEGRYYTHQLTPVSLDRALECFQRAIHLDPDYAQPYAGLALRVYYLVLYFSKRAREMVPSALTSLARALRLDPRSVDAHVARAVFSAFYEFDWNGAEEHFRQALEFDPSSARVRTVRTTWFLLPTGKVDEAVTE